MAIMIPEKPRDFVKESLEDVMFEALEKLPINYYVIHSFKNTWVRDGVLEEREADFLILHPQKGILCLEAKAGQVRYSNGEWLYGSGKKMKHGGPYNQASRSKWAILNRIQDSSLKEIERRCKFLHGVWFPSISQGKLYSMNFPAEADRNITLTQEALMEPEKYIEKIFDVESEAHVETDLSENDMKRLMREILCPEFSIFPSTSFNDDLKKIAFHRLLKEQESLLDYLVDQKSAVINGAAGTGKTMIAVTKAEGHANEGEKVLFLCFNSKLCDYLEQNHSHELIDYMTIDKLSCALCHTEKADYKKAKHRIEDLYLTGSFPYKHVIVDEGQDFGKGNIEESDILQTINDVVVDNDDINGTFYVFYDKLQLIQSDILPRYIEEADCKLTLYKNCRNTENIAVTSLKPISERNPKLKPGAVKGALATMHYCSNSSIAVNKVKALIDAYKENGVTDVVVLTCKTEKNSILSEYSSDGKFYEKTFTTCRKFKGLEADAIILVDLDKETFNDENVLLFYVGSSRARLYLELVTLMNDDEATEVLSDEIKYTKKIKKPKRDLALALNAFPAIVNE